MLFDLKPSKKPATIRIADFETNSHEKENNIYAWGYKNGKHFYYGVDIKSFLDTVIDCHIKGTQRHNDRQRGTVIYFHNLSRFDGEFIIKALPSYDYNGNKFHQLLASEDDKENTTYLRLSKMREKHGISKKEFDYNYAYEILKDSGDIFQITIYLSEFSKIRFNCSKLIFGDKLSVDEMGKMLGYPKLEQDYFRVRKYNTKQELRDSGHDYEYLKRDCEIVQKFLEHMDTKVVPQRLWKMTQAGIGYYFWKVSCFKLIFKRFSKFIIRLKNTKRELYYRKKENNRLATNKKGKAIIYSPVKIVEYFLPRLFPPTTKELDKELRKWYIGGYTNPNPKLLGKIINEVKYIDINSLYPSIMNSDKLFPIGEIFEGDGGKEYPLKLYKIVLKRDVNQTDWMPFMGQKIYEKRIYTNLLPVGTVFYLTKQELDFFIEKYNLKVQKDLIRTVIFSFKGISGKELFGPYIDHLYKHKETAPKTSIMYYFVKILMNAVYGKFATKIQRIAHIFLEKFIKNQQGRETSYEIEHTEELPKYFLPIGIYITTYARLSLFNANIPLSRFVASDTDSYIYDSSGGYKPDISFHNTELGKWSFDYDEKRLSAVTCGKKRYALYSGQKVKLLVASGYQFRDDGSNIFYRNGKKIPYTSREIIPAFIVGNMKIKQPQRKETKYGVWLNDKTKELPPVWDNLIENKERWFRDRKEFFDYFMHR